MSLTFIDSNLLVYAYDETAAAKRQQAQAVLKQLWQQQSGLLSVQVLQEFYNVATHKVALPLTLPQARDVLAYYQAWPCFSPSPDDVIAASLLQQRHQLSFWDSLIVLAAQRSGAEVLLTEDLQAGQRFGDVTVRNPFA